MGGSFAWSHRASVRKLAEIHSIAGFSSGFLFALVASSEQYPGEINGGSRQRLWALVAYKMHCDAAGPVVAAASNQG